MSTLRVVELHDMLKPSSAGAEMPGLVAISWLRRVVASDGHAVPGKSPRHGPWILPPGQ
jgi:hypothetical protein